MDPLKCKFNLVEMIFFILGFSVMDEKFEGLVDFELKCGVLTWGISPSLFL